MGIGISLILMAVGAVLAFAVHAAADSPINVSMVGVILLIFGGIGLVLSLLFWSSFATRRRSVGGTAVVTEREVTHDVY